MYVAIFVFCNGNANGFVIEVISSEKKCSVTLYYLTSDNSYIGQEERRRKE